MFYSSTHTDNTTINNDYVSYVDHADLIPCSFFYSNSPFVSSGNQSEIPIGPSPQRRQSQTSHNCTIFANSSISVTELGSNGTVESTGAGTSRDCQCTKEDFLLKRSTKKDRCNKVNTARGLRDGRVRLSVEVARKFFDLQDMLGFNKASKTVQWLLMHSKPAIKELAKSPRNATNCDSSVSKYEVTSVVGGDDGTDWMGGVNKPEGETMVRSIVRESRNKARERAKQRTIEKVNPTRA